VTARRVLGVLGIVAYLVVGVPYFVAVVAAVAWLAAVNLGEWLFGWTA
jgi:hypothetical protein